MIHNPILATDSYKASHWLQYPPGTTNTYSYVESRGGKYSKTLFFGLQYYLEEYLRKPITPSHIDEAEAFFTVHGEPFNREGWENIIKEHDGFLPLKIRAVPEGTIVPTHNVLMTVENTDPKCAWLTSYVETQLLKVWYPTTVATQSWHIKQIIKNYMLRTMGHCDGLEFKLHDFGARGVSSEESAAIGGAAHLVNFKGTDTIAGVQMAARYYQCPMAGFSIPASEHSTITTWGKDGELRAYENMLIQYAKPGALFACVSDSYDLYNAIAQFWGTDLKEKIINSGAMLVIRPDSGVPSEVVLKTFLLLEDKFGTTYNDLGFKRLNHVKVIQGDGVNEDSIRGILMTLESAGFSAESIGFGMGGALLQQVNRDTQRFAYKCSMAKINGEEIEVFKDPITDPKKASKKGRLDLVRRSGNLQTVPSEGQWGSVMKTVFENGKILNTQSMEEIRARSG